MTRTLRNTLGYACVGAALISSLAAAAEPPKADFAISKAGAGFLDQITFGPRKVLKDKPDGPGGEIRLVAAGDGTIDSLFRTDKPVTLVSQVESATDKAGITRVVGRYTDGKVSLPFVRQFKAVNATTLDVTEEVDFAKLDAAYRVASHQVTLPIAVNPDEHQRMLAFSGKHRVEMFRMDMNDVQRKMMNLSDNRGFMPYWDLGGVLQLPTGYTVWKANHADTMAYPIEQGDTAPGWADYSEDDWGLSVQVLDAQAAAPWGITINARTGVLSVAGYPASEPARAGADLGVRKLHFQLVLHETSWPAFYPCELDLATYAELLKYLKAKGEPQVEGALATGDFHLGMVRERIQPSIVLRAMYRGDDWRMGNIMKDIGQSATRGGSMAEREKRAQIFLDYVKKNGVPAVAPK